MRKTVRIFRYFKSSEIRYVIHTYLSNEVEQNLIYFLVDTGENYFFSLDYFNGKITELQLGNEVGFAPSFFKLNNVFFITIGGINGNCAAVNLYDIYNNKWYFVGNLSQGRSGAYVLLNNYDNIVYICGGVSADGDNTFDIEYFNLDYPTEIKGGNNLFLNQTYYPCEIKTKKIKNDYLLRKINPVVLPLIEDNSYLICGGSNIFIETQTCMFYYTDKELIFLSNVQLPKPVNEKNSNNSNSQNINFYKNSFYFFVGENQVVRYSVIENSFEVIQKEVLEV